MQLEWPSRNNDIPNFTYTAKEYIRTSIPSEVLDIYQFSKYIIDPNKHHCKTVVRILALVYRFIAKLKEKLRNKTKGDIDNVNTNTSLTSFTQAILSQHEIQRSENYFYQKATEEVKEFSKPSKYEKISSEKDKILYYTGRILPNQDIQHTGNPTDIMLDLSSTSFFVPIIHKNSPIAYSIISDIHWYHKVAKHSGVETLMPYVLQKFYVIEGRSVMKQIIRRCERCIYLLKRCVNIAMSPISKYILTIASPFYISQVDLAGPCNAYSPHNTRETIKIWLAVFCCSTTSTTNIKVMDTYDSNSFILAFTRFSCEVGYPKILLLDEGSQPIKECKNRKLNFQDIRHQLHVNVNVEFELCPVGGHNMND